MYLYVTTFDRTGGFLCEMDLSRVDKCRLDLASFCMVIRWALKLSAPFYQLPYSILTLKIGMFRKKKKKTFALEIRKNADPSFVDCKHNALFPFSQRRWILLSFPLSSASYFKSFTTNRKKFFCIPIRDQAFNIAQ